MTCEHAWVPMPKTLSGISHLRQCAGCGGRHIKGSPNYVRADGTLWRLPRKPADDQQPDTDDIGDV
jgi:hypothetical protein